MPDYYWDQNNTVPVDYLCSQWFLRPEWLQYMWVSSDQNGWHLSYKHAENAHAQLFAFLKT